MKRLVALLILAVAVSATLLPIGWVVLIAITKASYFGTGEALTLENFVQFFGARAFDGTLLFPLQLRNSLVIATTSAGLGVALSVTAAFAFSRMHFPLRGSGLRAMLLTQMFPAVVTAIPLLFLLDAVGLFGTRTGLVVVYATTSVPFSVWMLKGYFDAVPKELEQAARLDGASNWILFRRVMLPIVAPGVAITFVFSFMNAYNEFVLAALFLDDVEAYTLPVTLNEYVGGFDPNWGLFAAGSFVLAVPMVVLFYLVQKRLQMGVLAGAVKG